LGILPTYAYENAYRRPLFSRRLARRVLPCDSELRWGVALSRCNREFLLVASNNKVSYWQTAAAGLAKAATQMDVKAEMVGSPTYDPKAEHEEFQRIIAKKPSGILVSVSDVSVIAPDIDAAIAQGIPVITMDSDAPASKRLLFIGTNNYDAGKMGGQTLVKLLNGKGTVVVFSIPEQEICRRDCAATRACWKQTLVSKSPR